MSTSVTLSRSAGEPGMPMVLLDWRPLHPRRNTLCGYAKIMLGRSLMIDDVAVHASRGRGWAALPSKPVIINGVHAIDPKTGKPGWKNDLLVWASDTARNRFSNSVLRAVLESYPNALDDGS
jgi:hypothetical protein